MITAVAITLSIPLLLLLPFMKGDGRRTLMFLIYGYFAGLSATFILGAVIGYLPGSQYADIGVSPVVEGLFVVAPVIMAGLCCDEKVRVSLLGYAMASGFGFSIVETLDRIISLQLTGVEAAALAAARSASSSVMHGSAAALVGFGLLLLAGMPKKTLFPVIFGLFSISVTIHSFYNLFMGYVPGGLIPGLLLPWALFLILLVSYHDGFGNGVPGGEAA